MVASFSFPHLCWRTGDDATYRDYRDRCRAMATSLGFEKAHEVGRGDAMTAFILYRQ
jgi:hypothetical protein